MVDNFDILKPFLKFENKGDFYFLQLLQRKKDGCDVRNGLHNSARCVKDFYITSIEMFERIKDEVVSICNDNNARAYLRLNKRNFKNISLAFAENMLNKVRMNQEFRNPLVELASIVGQYSDAGKSKTWVVDIDDCDVQGNLVNRVEEVIGSCEPLDVNKVLLRVPTKSGVHLITRPFNVAKFNTFVSDVIGVESEICVHKDNPTILYCP